MVINSAGLRSNERTTKNEDAISGQLSQMSRVGDDDAGQHAGMDTFPIGAE
ncbi:hypothetical protein ACNKHO_26190 [Shigella flexneri]